MTDFSLNDISLNPNPNNPNLDREWKRFHDQCGYISDKQLDIFYSFPKEKQEYCLEYCNVDTPKDIRKYQFAQIFYITKHTQSKERTNIKYTLLKSYENPLEKIKTIFREPHRIHHAQTFEEGYKNLNDFELKLVMNRIPALNVPNVNQSLTIYPLDYPLTYTSWYEYGIQYKDQYTMKYLKFYDWVVFDYDVLFEWKDLKKFLMNIIHKIPNVGFFVYQTKRGYHVHMMNELIDYKSERYIHLSRLMGADPWYTKFSHRNGYKLRVSRKSNDEEFIVIPKGFVCGKHSCILSKAEQCRKLYESYIEMNTTL